MEVHPPGGVLHDIEGVRQRLLLKDKRAVYRLIESGQLPHYRVANKIRVSDEQIARFLAEREVVA